MMWGGGRGGQGGGHSDGCSAARGRIAPIRVLDLPGLLGQNSDLAERPFSLTDGRPMASPYGATPSTVRLTTSQPLSLLSMVRLVNASFAAGRASVDWFAAAARAMAIGRGSS